MRLTDYWMARLVYCGYVLMTYTIAFFDRETRVSELVTASGPAGWWVVAVVAALAAAGLLDILVNDFMPRAVSITYVHGRRHVLYMAIAIGSAGVSGVIATAEGWSLVLLKFWLDVVFGCALTFLEMFARHRSQVAK
jgi:hypothetical protein